jgi:hypothetical protein
MNDRWARLDAKIERTLSPDEVHAYLEHPISDAEREEVLALARWFRRRYPTPAARLAYARRAYARWRQTLETARRR